MLQKTPRRGFQRSPMDRTWSRFSPGRVPWRFVLITSYVIVNLILIPQKIILGPDLPTDWQWIRAMPDGIQNGTIYSHIAVYENGVPVPFVWSPVAALIMAGAATIGYWPWAALHVAAVFLLRDWRLIALVFVSYAFWWDVAQGNTVSLIFIPGVLALRGNRWAALAYLTALILVPRPLFAPLAVWLLWQDRSLWKPFVVIFVAHAAIVLASGYAAEWMSVLRTVDLAPGLTIGPTAQFGRWWLLVGVPLGAWLTWRGHVGWAGLAVSPYVTSQYLIWPLLDVVSKRQPTNNSQRPTPTVASGRFADVDPLGGYRDESASPRR